MENKKLEYLELNKIKMKKCNAQENKFNSLI